ncbi:hypothetical protein BaRGS_00016382 [Batillaria attramentaria]|uniref:Uncharacterized protein n=1 Tax=Batillaria attramentaria TaxID=370345 RepID=A0ABD0KYU5_9CAEN
MGPGACLILSQDDVTRSWSPRAFGLQGQQALSSRIRVQGILFSHAYACSDGRARLGSDPVGPRRRARRRAEEKGSNKSSLLHSPGSVACLSVVVGRRRRVKP